MKNFVVIILFLLSFIGFGQDCALQIDTVFVPFENKVLDCELMSVTLKNKSVFTFVKAPNKKLYVKFIVTENLYFNKKDQLEVRSGKRSFWVKDAIHYQHDKYKGYYFFEIYPNYVATLKDDGLTSIACGKAETDFGKSDSNQIKQLAKCFQESIAPKK